ncbi:MAG: hypothetical protein JXB00_04025 [Bacteroidales bacterium]|nr:hypothetical protein [Bacteroidales bacterium]
MNRSCYSPKECIKQLSLLFTAMLIGILIFAGFVVFIIVANNGGILGSNNFSYDILKWVFAVLVAFLIPFAIIIHRKRTDSINPSLTLEKKLTLYRNSFIFKIMLIDLICMLNSLLLLLYGEIYLVAPLALFITYFILNRPYVERIAEELNLSYREKSLLKDQI